jgi:hypothetical protein
MNLKVLKDDGFILTLVRPCEAYPLRRGITVDLCVLKEAVDLNKLFDSLLSKEVIEEIVKRVTKNEVLRKPKTRK